MDFGVFIEDGCQCGAVSSAGEGLQERCHPGRSLQSGCGDLLQERSGRCELSLLVLPTTLLT